MAIVMEAPTAQTTTVVPPGYVPLPRATLIGIIITLFLLLFSFFFQVKEGIAWKTDKDSKFKIPAEVAAVINDPAALASQFQLTRQSPNGFTLPRIDDEDFMVWMRLAGLPNFKKLHRKILSTVRGSNPSNPEDTTTIAAGSTVTVLIDNRYNPVGFSGKKYVTLSSTSWIGGKNYFLAYAFLGVAGLCLILLVIFAIQHCMNPRTPESMYGY
jgi:hypothetical protein